MRRLRAEIDGCYLIVVMIGIGTDVRIADMYKTLGCVVEVASPAERERLGISMAEATKAKKATLKAPVKYPKIKRRGPVKR